MSSGQHSFTKLTGTSGTLMRSTLASKEGVLLLDTFELSLTLKDPNDVSAGHLLALEQVQALFADLRDTLTATNVKDLKDNKVHQFESIGAART